MPEPAHEFGHGCTSLRREHGPRVPQVVPSQIRSPDLVPGLPPRPLKTGSGEPVARWRSQDESFAAGTDMILEMGLDHRDQVRRDRDVADAGGRLRLADDVTLATNADDATADTQNARLQIDVLATQFAHPPEPQSTKGCQRDRHRKSGRHSLGERLDLVQRGWRDLPDPRVCSTTLDPAGAVSYTHLTL